jgi:hypothetical protein
MLGVVRLPAPRRQRHSRRGARAGSSGIDLSPRCTLSTASCRPTRTLGMCWRRRRPWRRASQCAAAASSRNSRGGPRRCRRPPAMASASACWWMDRTTALRRSGEPASPGAGGGRPAGSPQRQLRRRAALHPTTARHATARRGPSILTARPLPPERSMRRRSLTLSSSPPARRHLPARTVPPRPPSAPQSSFPSFRILLSTPQVGDRLASGPAGRPVPRQRGARGRRRGRCGAHAARGV